MRSVSVRLADLENIKINLGYVGENEHVHILFDCKKAFDQYPNAVPSMVVVPPKGDAYPAVVTREGDIVEWVVTDSDLIYHGNGKIQLQFEQNDVVMKSAEARTFIAPSSIPTGTIPTPIQNWIAQANAILAEIPEDINSALAAAKASGEFDGEDGVGIASIAKTGTSGLVDTYTITLTDGSHYDIDVTNGTPGVGIQNIAKTSTVGLVDTYTITLTNGQTYPFTVTNGQNGVEIDDTTPAVNKVFSSSKVDQELTDVKTAIQGLEDDKYEKPSGGIPSTDMSQAVQDALADAESAYQKPQTGIPATDLADDALKKWELIADYTVPTDAASVEIATDTNGQYFELESMYVRAALENPTTANNDYVSSNVIYKDNNDVIRTQATTSLRYNSGTAKIYLDYFVKLIYRFWVMFAKAGVAFSNSQSAQMSSFYNYDSSMTVKTICGFKLSQYNSTSTLIPQGSNIKIYGIRK